MARLRGHRPLNAEEPLYVRRAALTLNGETFHAGDVLPWKDLGVPFKKLHQLWSGRRIGHEKPNDRNGAESQSALISTVKAQAPKQRKQRAAG